MKPFYVILLMGAAALLGGMLVRYSDHPVEITLSRPVPPNVVAPPIPPTAHVGPSTSVPVRTAPPVTREPEPSSPPHPEKRSKPSVFADTVHVRHSDTTNTEPKPVARVRMPVDPPTIVRLERSTVPPPAPVPAPTVAASAPAPAPTPLAMSPKQPPADPTPQPNHATLRAGMLITVRINEALSSNLNSAGDVFSGVLDKPLIADGFVIAERGAHVRGEVVESKSQELSLRLREVLSSDGQRVHLVSQPWRIAGVRTPPRNVYDAALTRDAAAVVRPSTSVTFRLDQPVELTEKRP